MDVLQCCFSTQQFNNPFSQGLTLEQNMALCDIQAHGLETLLMQERMKRNPFVLQFHQNRSTSTGDLMNGPSSKLWKQIVFLYCV